MALTRRDARLIAEELFRLQQQEHQQQRISAREAADILGWSLSTLYHNAHLIGDTRGRQRGKRLSFSLSNVEAFKQKRLEQQ